jgi:hypothetical protein
MARVATRLQIRNRARQLSNTESDPNITDSELNELVNLHLPSVYELCLLAGPADYYAASYTVSVTAGTSAYALPSDFRALTEVMLVENADWRRPLEPLRPRRRGGYKAPTSSATVELEYLPSCPIMSDDADTFDGVDGWDELISAKIARDVIGKRKSDPSLCLAIIAETEKRIRSLSTSRDKFGGKQITDVETDTLWPRSVRIDAYRLRAGNIEFFESSYGMHE